MSRKDHTNITAYLKNEAADALKRIAKSKGWTPSKLAAEILQRSTVVVREMKRRRPSQRKAE